MAKWKRNPIIKVPCLKAKKGSKVSSRDGCIAKSNQAHIYCTTFIPKSEKKLQSREASLIITKAANFFQAERTGPNKHEKWKNIFLKGWFYLAIEVIAKTR